MKEYNLPQEEGKKLHVTNQQCCGDCKGIQATRTAVEIIGSVINILSVKMR